MKQAMRNLIIPTLLLIPIIFTYACNKKCSSIDSTVSGADVALYDFKECFIYAHLDTTLVIQSDTAFASYKAKYLKNCNTASMAPIDFTQKVLLGYRIKGNACNVAFHRIVEIDDTNKIYKYKVLVESCGGCGTDVTSTNIITAPKIPPGYKLVFETGKK